MVLPLEAFMDMGWVRMVRLLSPRDFLSTQPSLLNATIFHVIRNLTVVIAQSLHRIEAAIFNYIVDSEIRVGEPSSLPQNLSYGFMSSITVNITHNISLSMRPVREIWARPLLASLSSTSSQLPLPPTMVVFVTTTATVTRMAAITVETDMSTVVDIALSHYSPEMPAQKLETRFTVECERSGYSQIWVKKDCWKLRVLLLASMVVGALMGVVTGALIGARFQ
jgi:hypothetical protein